MIPSLKIFFILPPVYCSLSSVQTKFSGLELQLVREGQRHTIRYRNWAPGRSKNVHPIIDEWPARQQCGQPS